MKVGWGCIKNRNPHMGSLIWEVARSVQAKQTFSMEGGDL
jgi:hypothetical protein